MNGTDKPMENAGAQAEPATPAGLEADARWELVNRIASSVHFKKSPRLRQFLLFVAERSLTGHTEELTEYTIGWKVFERGIDYNPSDDSIVRTTARQLRTKVKEYFESNRASEPWTLEIPKGGYVPVFAKRDQEEITTALPKLVARDSSALTSLRRWKIIAASLAVISICSLAYILRPTGAVISSASRVKPSIISTVLSDGPQPTRLVVGDFGAVLMALASKRVFSAEEYSSHSHANASPDPKNPIVSYLWNVLAGGQVVSLPDVRILGTILRSSWEERKNVVVQHAGQITARDLRSGSSILLTSTFGNPWMTMFEDKLNFRFRLQFNRDGPGGISEYVNTRPLPGERALYTGDQSAPRSGLAYGLVARVPNLTGTGKILLICGQKFTGLEAAGEYATDPKAAADLARVLSVKDIREAPDFEVLIETYSIDTTPRYVKAVAFRRIGG